MSMIRRIRAWLAPRRYRVIAGGYYGAIWECRLCPATGCESNGPRAYAAVTRHLAVLHGIVEAKA